MAGMYHSVPSQHTPACRVAKQQSTNSPLSTVSTFLHFVKQHVKSIVEGGIQQAVVQL